jgi:phosphoserine aminotransferase
MPERIHNFAAGPSALPASVLEIVHSELFDYRKSGISMLELSHRHALVDPTLLLPLNRQVMALWQAKSDEFELLWMQGGGTGQFAAWIMNCLPYQPADGEVSAEFVVTGSWSEKAYEEAVGLMGDRLAVKQVINTKASKHTGAMKDWTWMKDEKIKKRFVYFCDNETIHGVEFPMGQSPLDVGQCPYDRKEVHLICDMSSNLLSRPVPHLQQFSLIFGGCQKNMGISGATMVLIRKDLLQWIKELRKSARGFPLPTALSYTVYAESQSLYHTPPMFSLYLAKLVSDWIYHRHFAKEESLDLEPSKDALSVLHARNQRKAQTIYSYLDTHSQQGELFYVCPVNIKFRSSMTIPIRIVKPGIATAGKIEFSEELEKTFVKQAEDHGLVELKGHRSVGGLRVCLYNTITVHSVQKLIAFMDAFRKQQ